MNKTILFWGAGMMIAGGIIHAIYNQDSSFIAGGLVLMWIGLAK